MLATLEYSIGKIEIAPDKLKYEGVPYYAPHKFITHHINGDVFLYVAPAPGQVVVANRFHLNEKDVVGGGSCYIDEIDRLVMSEFSNAFGSVPKEPLDILANLLSKHLHRQGIETKGVITDTPIDRVNNFWYDKGFSLD